MLNQQPQNTPPQPRKNIASIWRSGPAGKCGVIAGALVILIALSLCIGVTNAAIHGGQVASTNTTKTPALTPTPLVVHYPPKTVSDLRGLAAKGNEDAIHPFKSDTTGATGVCPQPRREVMVDQSVTGQQLAENLLAYFYDEHLDSPCGSLVLAYHQQSEGDGAFTAGRVNFDVTDSSGTANTDPNGTDLKYTLTLDVGDIASGKEYSVSY